MCVAGAGPGRGAKRTGTPKRAMTEWAVEKSAATTPRSRFPAFVTNSLKLFCCVLAATRGTAPGTNDAKGRADAFAISASRLQIVASCCCASTSKQGLHT